jgi:hypothetical protein
MTPPLLIAASPLTVPARNYDRVWIEAIEITAPSPSGDATARVRLRRFDVDEAGVVHTEPDSQKLEVENLLAASQADPDLAAAVGSLMSYIAKIGVAQGVIAPPAE